MPYIKSLEFSGFQQSGFPLTGETLLLKIPAFIIAVSLSLPRFREAETASDDTISRTVPRSPWLLPRDRAAWRDPPAANASLSGWDALKHTNQPLPLGAAGHPDWITQE